MEFCSMNRVVGASLAGMSYLGSDPFTLSFYFNECKHTKRERDDHLSSTHCFIHHAAQTNVSLCIKGKKRSDEIIYKRKIEYCKHSLLVRVDRQ